MNTVLSLHQKIWCCLLAVHSHCKTWFERSDLRTTICRSSQVYLELMRQRQQAHTSYQPPLPHLCPGPLGHLSLQLQVNCASGHRARLVPWKALLLISLTPYPPINFTWTILSCIFLIWRTHGLQTGLHPKCIGLRLLAESCCFQRAAMTLAHTSQVQVWVFGLCVSGSFYDTSITFLFFRSCSSTFSRGLSHSSKACCICPFNW